MLPKNKLWTKNFQCMTFASAFLQQRKTNLTGRRREARLKMTSFQDFSGWHILLSLSGWPTGFAQKWIFLNKGITSWDEGETRPDLNRFRVFGNYFLVLNYAYSNLLILFQRLTRQGGGAIWSPNVSSPPLFYHCSLAVLSAIPGSRVNFPHKINS